MKQVINYQTSETPQNVQVFIWLWKKAKHYPQTPYVTIGECWELLSSTTRQLHREEIASGTYNYALIDEEGEFILAWDGDEPLDLLLYKTIRAVKRYITRPLLPS